MVWLFERGSERLAVAISRNATAYEVHVQQPDGTRTLDFSGGAHQLVARLPLVPEALAAAGWRPRRRLELHS